MIARILVVALFFFTKSSEAFIIVKSSTSHTHRFFHQLSAQNDNSVIDETRRRSLWKCIPMLAATLSFTPNYAMARLEGINRPDLLPNEPNLNVIQTEKFLTSGQVKRMNDMLINLERDTGFRLRVLCQSYPNTPGLGMHEFHCCLVFMLPMNQ